MEDKNVKRNNVAVLKFPKDLDQFVKDNPTFTEKVGKIIVQVAQMKEFIELYDEMLGHPEYFMQWVKKGNLEDAKRFLEIARKEINSNGIVVINDISAEDRAILSKIPGGVSQDLGVIGV